MTTTSLFRHTNIIFNWSYHFLQAENYRVSVLTDKMYSTLIGKKKKKVAFHFPFITHVHKYFKKEITF